MNYSLGQYFDQDTGRYRWGVFSYHSDTWCFASSYGRLAAERYYKRLCKND